MSTSFHQQNTDSSITNDSTSTLSTNSGATVNVSASVSGHLISEVHRLNKNYADNWETLETEKALAMQEHREKLQQEKHNAAQLALSEIIKGAEASILHVAQFGRKNGRHRELTIHHSFLVLNVVSTSGI